MPTWKRIVGIGLIIVGIIALVTPFTPGAWLIFVGLALLGFEISEEHGNTWLGKAAQRFGVKVKPKPQAPRAPADEVVRPPEA